MTKIKICGITNPADAQAATEAGADLLGFIFYEPSPRYVTPERANSIIAEQLAASDSRPVYVGVFVNSPLEMVRQIAEFAGLDAVQLHGEEPPAFVEALAGRAFKALRPQSPAEAESLIEPYLPCSPQAERPCFLLDAYHPTLYGGTGQVTDWSMAARIACQYPIMLAGSLTPTNVVEAIRAVRPWGVDVSSGVEVAKGRKDHAKVRAFINAVKGVSHE